MRSGRWLLTSVTLLLAATGLAMADGQFAPPAEGPVAFRRDLIPLEVEAISGLSQQLEILARALTPATPADQRGAAQALALALALDPANTKARDLIAEYGENHHQAAPSAVAALAKSRSGLKQYLPWLESPAAGNDAHALAACLKDVIPLGTPEYGQADELGAWTDWVPSLDAYQPKVVNHDNVPDKSPVATSPIKLRKAQVQTVLWRKVRGGEEPIWSLSLASLGMSADSTSRDQDFAIAIGPAPRSSGLVNPPNRKAPVTPPTSGFEATEGMLCNLLAAQHDLPTGYKIAINSPELEQSIQSSKRQSISAAAAVLASAALTGTEPDAVILGSVDDAGSFKLPTAFWDQLRALGKGNGQRLVLPAAAADYLPSLLALEKPGFFFDYEVVLAADFKQLLELSAKTSKPPLDKASTSFHEIRNRIGSQDVRQFISNRFVRQRLMEILQEIPYHYSTKMLLLQASGNRPTTLARNVLAAELRCAIEPMAILATTVDSKYSAWLDRESKNRYDVFEFTSSEIAKIDPAFDVCRSRIDALERYATKDDRELVEQTRKAVGLIRTLGRATRTRGNAEVVNDAIGNACTQLVTTYTSLTATLTQEAGDPPAPPPPPPVRDR